LTDHGTIYINSKSEMADRSWNYIYMDAKSEMANRSWNYKSGFKGLNG
jgi:hypothetical protein